MGQRSGVLDHDEDIAKLTLEELDAEIARCTMRMRIAPNLYQRRSFFKRLTRLEALREKLHGVEAPVRRMRARQK
jgi:hypothetical protein